VTTRTKPSDFPSALRQKLSIVQTVERHQVQTERIDANTDCPKCGRRGIRYSEVQQRSADEGSTIIYNCDCGERCDNTRTPRLIWLLTLDMQMDHEQLSTFQII
jgi:DNA-directed RNA polymerase I subunit RPA12